MPAAPQRGRSWAETVGFVFMPPERGFAGKRAVKLREQQGRLPALTATGPELSRAPKSLQGSPGAQSPGARVLGMQPPGRAALQPTQPDDGEHKTTVIALITSTAERRGQAGELVRRRKRKDLRGKGLALTAAPSPRRRCPSSALGTLP